MEKKLTYKNSSGNKITAIVKKVNDDCFAVDYGMNGDSWQLVMNCPFIGGSDDFPIIDKEWNKQNRKENTNEKRTKKSV